MILGRFVDCLLSGTTNDVSSSDETRQSWGILLVLLILFLSILMSYAMFVARFHYLPESIAVIAIGLNGCYAHFENPSN